MDILQFCRPEAVGVHPSLVENYVNEMNRRHKMHHSFVMMRGGKVFAEGYWKPFHREWLHRMYSVSKTFVSAAVGMLADEGKLKLSDPIIQYFPEKDTAALHPYIREMTIRDMLMMSTCHVSNAYRSKDPDWLHVFFYPHNEPDHKAGTEFRYDTSATYTLCVLVARLAGQEFLDYLKDKALREIGFTEKAWCVEAPDGHMWGGSGVECTTLDLARFAMIFACKGVINGKRYLSEEYINAATSKQIENYTTVRDAAEGWGYGYQIWRVRDNCYAFLGMGGQIALVVPHKDLIFTCNSDMQGDADGYHCIVDILFDTVIDHMSDGEIETDDAAFDRMNAVLGALEVAVPAGENTSPILEKINGARYVLSENSMGMREISFSFSGSAGILTYYTDRGEKHFPLCLGRYADTVFPETHYSGKRINQPLGKEYRCLNAAVFTAPDTLLVRSYVIDDYFGNMSAEFKFDGEKITLNITKTAEWFMDEYPGTAEGVRV